ncbi:MAG: hypothetical protein EPO28_07365 [Saprospiraceae bacterium]|nr:MAG: hypothetical protein EPO28_07365 [Saprospiraceae bacterium]
MPKKKKTPKKEQPKVHDELRGFDIKINEFGEIQSNLGIEKLNEFLNENLEDKKLAEKKLKDEEE